MELEPGRWARVRVEVWRPGGRGPGHEFTHAKVVSEDGGTVTLERWEVAKITRRTKAFGQRIDKTPYRVGGVFKAKAEDVTLLPESGLTRQLEQTLERVMRYPTYAERRRLRDKARRQK